MTSRTATCADIAETERRTRYGVSHPGDDYRLRALRLREASLAATLVNIRGA